MLNILHKKINDIIPIISIENLGDNNYNIFYQDETLLNEQLSTEIQNIIESWPLEKHRIYKIQELDTKWTNKIDNGWSTTYGWKLGLTNNDITLLTGAFLLAKEASNLGLSNNANIVDINGVTHTLSLSDFTTLMLEYGIYRSQISSTYSNLLVSINNTTSITELNNINIDI